jgi:hypothetical protein
MWHSKSQDADPDTKHFTMLDSDWIRPVPVPT